MTSLLRKSGFPKKISSRVIVKLFQTVTVFLVLRFISQSKIIETVLPPININLYALASKAQSKFQL